MSRRALVAALEALEAGDQELLAAILLGALEDVDTVQLFKCRACDARFRWPGLRDAHQLLAHGLEDAA